MDASPHGTSPPSIHVRGTVRFNERRGLSGWSGQSPKSMRMRMRMRALGAVSIVGSVASCSLITNMDGFSGTADGSGDAADGSTATTDGSTPAPDGSSRSTCDEPGLVARWTFDEGAGSVVHDCTSFKHDGQMVNAGWATGLSGGGGSFDGGWVAVPDDPKLQITRELTVCAWVRVREFPTTAPSGFLPTAYIVGKRSNGTNGWRLALGAQPEVMIGVLPSSDLKGAMPSTGWTHVAAVYRPSVSIELYVNGKSAAQVTTTIPTAITDSQSELRIGNRYDGVDPLMGELDDVRVYERALSATEITSLFTNH